MPTPPALFRALLRSALPCAADFARQTQAATVLDFGPVSLPAMDGLIIQDGMQGALCAPRPCLAVCSFGLSRLSEYELASRLDALHAAAEHVMFLEFKMPERNLELPSCLLLSGLRRLYGQKDCALQTMHGLEGLLWRESARFQPVERRTLLGGGLLCVLATCLHHEENA